MGDERRPTVLWVTDEPPGRAAGGGNIRQAHVVEGVARRADVHLVVLGEVTDPSVRAAVHELTERPDPGLLQARSKTARRGIDLWLALVARGPWQVALAGRRRRAVRGLVRRLEPTVDLVVLQHQGMAALLPRRRTARWVAELHHVSSVQAAQERAITAGRRQRWLLVREERKAERFERWVLGRADAVVVVSEADADALRRVAGAAPRCPVHVAPNGVDTAAYAPTPLPAEPAVLMTGTFDYLPNTDGARWLCEEVLPAIHRHRPDATATLAGRSPTPAVRALGDRPGVEVHGDVPAMAPFFERARATVVPLRIGSGTRLKALESMAAGRPVVGTTIGFAGIDLEPGVHALVADDTAGLADALVRVLDDDALAAGLAAAGRALVVDRYEWSAIADRLADELLGAAP